MSTPAPRTVRQDSVRNREKLVAAAREVFAERGFGATLDDIARHAGFGTGTAYRHFRNKQALAAEVLAGATTAILEDATRAASIGQPWAAFVDFCERTATRQAADRGLYESLTGQGDDEEQARIWPQIVVAVTGLFERAQAAGAIRSDAVPQDVAALFSLLGPAFEMSRATGTEVWRRYLALLLDGLRESPDHTPLVDPAPPVEQLDAILFAGKPRGR